jgi:hypothetical protein
VTDLALQVLVGLIALSVTTCLGWAFGELGVSKMVHRSLRRLPHRTMKPSAGRIARLWARAIRLKRCACTRLQMWVICRVKPDRSARALLEALAGEARSTGQGLRAISLLTRLRSGWSVYPLVVVLHMGRNPELKIRALRGLRRIDSALALEAFREGIMCREERVVRQMLEEVRRRPRLLDDRNLELELVRCFRAAGNNYVKRAVIETLREGTPQTDELVDALEREMICSEDAGLIRYCCDLLCMIRSNSAARAMNRLITSGVFKNASKKRQFPMKNGLGTVHETLGDAFIRLQGTAI